MNNSKNKRAFIAWVLLMTFMPFFVVKALHHHEEELADTCCTHADHPQHSADDCAICHFSLSLFTEAQQVDFHCILTPTPFQPVIYQDKTVFALSYTHHLRGPPIA